MSKDRNNKKGFTLAEVLITLTIIGVVAALTIPSLLANVSDKTYEAKRKGLRTRMAQAFSQLDSLNSYEAKKPSDYSGELTDNEYSEANSSMNFITEGLSKVYHISNVCESTSYAACDFPAGYGTFHSSGKLLTANLLTLSQATWGKFPIGRFGGLDVNSVFFRTKNGESIQLWYNPKCVPEQDVDPTTNEKIWAKEVCVVMKYDLDGAKKGPNEWDRDMGQIIVLYSDTPFVVAPRPLQWHANTYRPSYAENGDTASAYCENWDSNNGGYSKGSWRLSTREELYAREFAWPLDAGKYNWSSTVDGSGPDDYGWVIGEEGIARYRKRSEVNNVTCILKDNV